MNRSLSRRRFLGGAVASREAGISEQTYYRWRKGVRRVDMATPIARDLGYSKSIHQILRRIADSVKASGKIPSTSPVEALFDTEFHFPSQQRLDIWR